MRLSLFLLVTLGLAQFSCAQKSITKDLLSTDFLAAPGSKQLTFMGDNERPRFSPDGDKLIYSSRARGHHKPAQIYELQWSKNIERRVTFSDGDSFNVIYLNDGEVLYSSTTDEIKESPLLNKNFDKENPPSELYQSDLFGTEITRLTTQPGYDAEPVWISTPKKSFLVFSSHRGELRGLYRMDMKTKQVNFLSVEKEKDKRSPAVTPDGNKLAWIEIDPVKKTQQVILATITGKEIIKDPQVIKDNDGIYKDLFFAPEAPYKLFYSIVRKGDKKSQLEVYDVENKCTRVIFKAADSLYSPVLSKNNKLAFAREFQGKKQIYIADLPNDLGPCLEASLPATLEK